MLVSCLSYVAGICFLLSVNKTKKKNGTSYRYYTIMPIASTTGELARLGGIMEKIV